MGELLAIAAAGLLWSFLNGELSWGNILFGAVLGMIMLSVMERNVKRSLPRRVIGFLVYFVNFIKEMVLAGFVNVRLALSPRPRFHPMVVAVPLTVKSDAAIALLGLTISLIPGISPDKKFMYCHAVNQADPATHKRGILRIESLILEFME